MASDRNFCGFNAGDASGLSAASGLGSVLFISTAAKHLGAYGLELLKTVASASGYAQLPITTLTTSSDTHARGAMRVFFQVPASGLPSVDHHLVAGFTAVSTHTYAATMELDTTGHFRARASTVVSAYSAAALVEGAWYEAVVTFDLFDKPSGFDTMDTTVSVYTMDGTLVETVTVNNAAVGTGPYTIQPPTLGSNTAVSATAHFFYANWAWAANVAEASAPVLPAGKIIYPCRITGQGAADDWTPAGGWERIDEIPFDPSGPAGEEITSASAVDTTYTHQPLSVRHVETVYGWKVYANVKGSGAQAVLLDGVEYAHTPAAAYAVGPGTGVALDWTERDAATFDAGEFGYRNKTGATLGMGGLTSEFIADPPAWHYVGGGGLTIGGESAVTFTEEADFGATDGRTSVPVAWVELTDRDAARHVFAEVDLNDPASYYGGYKRPWVLSWLPVSRGLSDRAGQMEHASFGALLSDVTRFFRGLLAGPKTRYLTNRPLVERIIDDEARRAEKIPRVLAVGYTADYSPRPDLKFELRGSDWLKKKFSRKASAGQAWQPLITLDDFPYAGDEYLTETTATRAVGAVGLPVPIVLGKLSDYALEARQVPDPDASTPGNPGDPGHTNVLAFDPTISRVERSAGHRLNDGLSSFALGERVNFIITVLKDGKEGDDPFFGGLNMDPWPGCSASVNWNAVPGADGYRVYMYDGVGFDPRGNAYNTTKVRFQAHDNVTTDGLWGYDYTIVWRSWDDGEMYPNVTGGTEPTPPVVLYKTIYVDIGKGLYRPRYVGDYEIGGVVYRGALVAGHACAYLESAYRNGAVVDLETDPDWLTPRNAAAWAAAGFATPYTDINGRRYTLIYLKGTAGDLFAGVTQPDEGQVAIAMNLWGAETVGDGSGAVIETPAQQALWLLNNFLAPDTPYQSGAYLTAQDTTYPHVPNLPLVDEPSFAAVDVAAADRTPGGYVSAVAVVDAITALDLLAWFAVGGDFDFLFNRKFQIGASMEPIYQSTGVAGVDDVTNIVDRSFEILDEVTGAFFNIFPFAHSRDLVGRFADGWGVIDETRSDVSIAMYEQERTAPRVELQILRGETAQGAATILDVMARKRGRYQDPRRRVTLALPFSGLSYEPGDVFPITHIEGIGAEGWVDHDVRVARHEVDLDAGQVRLDCYDLESLWGLSGLWAPDGTPDRDGASEAEKLAYLFWAPDAPDNFYSDGAAVKSWS
jgi:hypothetical protein